MHLSFQSPFTCQCNYIPPAGRVSIARLKSHVQFYPEKNHTLTAQYNPKGQQNPRPPQNHFSPTCLSGPSRPTLHLKCLYSLPQREGRGEGSRELFPQESYQGIKTLQGLFKDSRFRPNEEHASTHARDGGLIKERKHQRPPRPTPSPSRGETGRPGRGAGPELTPAGSSAAWERLPRKLSQGHTLQNPGQLALTSGFRF